MTLNFRLHKNSDTLLERDTAQSIGQGLRRQASLKPRHHFRHRFVAQAIAVLADHTRSSAVAQGGGLDVAVALGNGIQECAGKHIACAIAV